MSPQHNAPPRNQAPAQRVQIGDALLKRGLISQAQLEDALEHQRTSGHSALLGEVLMQLGFVSDRDIMQCLAECYGIPYAHVTPRIADPRVLTALPREFVNAHAVLPLFDIKGTLTVAVSEPANLYLIEEIERLSGKRIRLVAATAQDIRTTIQAYLPSANVFVIDELYQDVDVREFIVDESQSLDIGDIEDISGQSPVIKLVNYILFQAIQDRASDIHIEAGDHISRVRFRIDGRLACKLTPPYQMHAATVSRVKIMAGMDISERRVPQDGDIHVAIEGRPVDLRVSTMPGKFGEKIVIRIIDNRSAIIALDRMGMASGMLERWRTIIRAPHGMVLVTGPTGSGKSTSLYGAIAEIASDELNISTVENPVEAQMPGINQFQVNEKAGFTFATALRSLLRQDPDVIMVGEIRDVETATIATQAALTGHLVLSTLHTNDAVAAAPRLVNMGVDPYLVAAMLQAVLAQRLVRKICPHCREGVAPDEVTLQTLAAAGLDASQLFRGVGCGRCRASGYAGRIGIFELFVPDPPMLELIAAGAVLQELRAEAEAKGHAVLRDDGLQKAAAGLTTVDEVLRVCAG